MGETWDVVIVGGGQAGLSLSHELSRSKRDHVILERGRVGQSWRTRWDSFCLVLPNWTVRLAGQPYEGPDPDGFMARDVFVAYLAHYAEAFKAPVREGVSVQSLDREGDGSFLLQTSTGEVRAREVVVATGGYQKPYRPAGARQLDAFVPVIGVEAYSNPGALPPGRVLVVGSGQSGCQIAEDLHLAGRDVVLSCGRAPWQPRRVAGRDIMAWMLESPFMQMTAAQLASPAMRLAPNPQCTGRDGGHDLHYRTLQAMGVVLAGHLDGVQDGRAHFAADLADTVAFGDARYNDIRGLIWKSAAAQGLPVPEIPDPAPFVADPPDSVNLGEFGAAVIAGGFRPDYLSWIRMPHAFDAMGLPLQEDGSSTVVPGLHFAGVPFQRKRTSASLMGVGEDAAVLAERMAGSRRTA
jgi:putative flavoprotein involved in K+ transport